VFPALAIAAELRRRDPSREMLFLGSERGLETRLVPAAGFPLRTLRIGGLAGKSAAVRAASSWRALRAVGQCLALFLKRRPAAVIGVGGFASGPAVLAALALRVPTLIHEQNAAPGMTNRWLAPFVDEVAVSFPGTEARFRRPCRVTGNPVREEFFRIAAYGGMRERLRLLVSGGSRGARTLNLAAIASLGHLPDLKDRISIVHQTGEADFASVRDSYGCSGFDAEARPFLDDMPARLEAADLAVTRAGAGTVFELAAAGRASILVPYPFAAGGHQEQNAAYLASAGSALVVRDAELTGETLARLVREALASPASLLSRATAARALARPDAAGSLADMAERLMERSR